MPTSQLEPAVRFIRQWAGHEATRRLTDAELVERFAVRREETAFAALVRRHGQLVFGVCRRVLRHEQDAEDSFQATFILLAQKIESIRKGQSVASWLYGVAYRMARNAKRKSARRRANETRGHGDVETRRALFTASPSPRVSASFSPPAIAGLNELQAILDEEVNRLPERYRSAFVLCCLQGKSVGEAAKELGCKEKTVASQLARARHRLQAQLVRRGVTLSTTLAAAAVAEGSLIAAVPASLTNATIDAAILSASGKALAAVLPASVAALVKGMSKAMVLAKVKVATGILLAASIVIGGSGVYGPRLVAGLAGEQPEQQTKKARDRASKPKDAPTAVAAKSDGTLQITGRVLDPDGKPAAGAKIYVTGKYGQSLDNMGPVSPSATTGRDGRFQFKTLRANFPADDDQASYGFKIVALADGFAPDAASLHRFMKEEVTLRLVRAEPTIQGRILDLQGKPVAGAAVSVDSVYGTADQKLTPFVNDLKGSPWRTIDTIGMHLGLHLHRPDISGLVSKANTDADGRFKLPGFGRERLVMLKLEGPSIATAVVWIIPRAVEEVKAIARSAAAEKRPGYPRVATPGMHAATFEHVANPTKVFMGTVREHETGKPLSDVTISGQPTEGGSWQNEAKTTSDASGRFRLTGLPKTKEVRLRVIPKDTSGYLPAERKVGGTEGLEPIQVDFKLAKGIEIKGRVTEKGTGKPVSGAEITCEPLQGNEFFNKGAFKDFYFKTWWAVTDTDGNYRVFAMPGLGFVSVRKQGPSGQLYMAARISEEDRKKSSYHVEREIARIMLADGSTHMLLQLNPKAFRTIDPRPDVKSVTCNLEMDRGLSLTGFVVDTEGKPLNGVQVAGLEHEWLEYQSKMDGNKFTANVLDPEQPRSIRLVHVERKLIGHAVVRGDESKPPIVRMTPWVAVKGRLLDADGKPLAGLRVEAIYRNKDSIMGRQSLWWAPVADRDVVSDADGRFEYSGLMPGLNFIISVRNKQGWFESDKLKDLTVKAGETLDLGEIEAKPPKN